MVGELNGYIQFMNTTTKSLFKSEQISIKENHIYDMKLSLRGGNEIVFGTIKGLLIGKLDQKYNTNIIE